MQPPSSASLPGGAVKLPTSPEGSPSHTQEEIMAIAVIKICDVVSSASDFGMI